MANVVSMLTQTLKGLMGILLVLIQHLANESFNIHSSYNSGLAIKQCRNKG